MDGRRAMTELAKAQVEDGVAPERTLPIQLTAAEKAIAEVRSTFGLEVPLARRSEQLRELARMHAVAVAGELDGLGRELQRTIIDLKRVIAPPAMSRQEAGAQKGKGGVSDTPPFTKEQVKRQRALARVPEATVNRVFREAEAAGETPSEADVLKAHQEDTREERREEREAKAAARRQEAYDAVDWRERQAVIHAECGRLETRGIMPPFDAVFTDPPYERSALDCWDELAREAVRLLRPGGLLLALTGQMFLPEVLDALRRERELQYRWTGWLVWRSPRQTIHAAKVTSGGKPFLVFTKRGAQPEGYAEDTFHAGPYRAETQATHPWGQDAALMAAVAKEWLEPGWKVLDPFCGEGTLLKAAQDVGCIVQGCDSDRKHVETARLRLQQHGPGEPETGKEEEA